MSILLVHELHEARDRISVLVTRLKSSLEIELPVYRPFLAEQIASLDEALVQANIPESYRVAVVGRFKVGKSSFVNKLAGERLAGVDTNPETAAISIFKYGTEANAQVELVSDEDWKELKELYELEPQNPEVKRYEKFINFNDRPARKDRDGKDSKREKIDLNALGSRWIVSGGLNYQIAAPAWDKRDGKKEFLQQIRKFTSSQEPLHYLVNKLTIQAPIPILRDSVELVDTPGLDDTERFRVVLTENLVKDVDAILFLTISGASYSQSDKEFIVRQLRRKQIKHLQIIVTKCDETYENSIRDAEANDDDPPTFAEFTKRETDRVRSEVRATLDELLSSNQLSDEDGYYFIDQLDNVPIQLISTKYHDEKRIEDGGIEAVRDKLFQTLSTSNRFEQSRKLLTDRLDLTLDKLRRNFAERLATLEAEFDPAKVIAEIQEVRQLLSEHLDEYESHLGEAIGLLKRDQEAATNLFPLYLDLVAMQAKEVLSELEKKDLARHWKARRYKGWGSLTDLEAMIADKTFPKIEVVLNELRDHFTHFMISATAQLEQLQAIATKLEQERQLTGMEALNLSSALLPMLESLQAELDSHIKAERDAIVSNLDDFISEEVHNRLEKAKEDVSDVWGAGTVARQSEKVSEFYRTVRVLLTGAIRSHVESRFQSFADAIRLKADSVTPRIRQVCELAIANRLAAIESALQVESEGQKDSVAKYLSEALGAVSNFAADPASVGTKEDDDEPIQTPQSHAIVMSPKADDLRELHYEILDGATGYTYERVFRPYIDTASAIVIEDPYIIRPHQVDNLSRFCALAVRLGEVKLIELKTGKGDGIREDVDDADSRLETLCRDLANRKIHFTWSRSATLHDREIHFDNGWIIKIGRGLDFYHRPDSWVSVAATDFSLRPCKQTKVDVYRH